MKKIWTFSFYFLYYAALSFFMPFIVLFYQELVFTGPQIALLTGIPPLITLFSAPFWTSVADSTHRHRLVMSVGIGVSIVSVFLLQYMDSFGVIFLTVLIFNFFFSPVASLSDSATLSMLGADRAMYGRVRLGGTIGWGLFALITGTVIGRIMLLVLPVLAISILMTITLRWLGDRHADIFEKESILKTRRIVILTAIAIAIGGLTGFGLTRWGESTVRAVRDTHTRLQTAFADAAHVEAVYPLSELPGLESHLGTPYTLYGHPSGQSVVAAEITANFDDGYQITCVLLVFPDKPPFLRACAEGENVTLPGNQ